MAGVPVPLQAVEHMYVVTEPLDDLPDPFPIVRDLDGGIYLKADAGKLVLGGFEPKAKLWDPQGPDGDRAFLELPEDWEQFEPFMWAGLERVPGLEHAGIQHFMNGPESFTPDTAPLLGESPFLEGFYVAAGFNSTGMMSSAGAGRVMALLQRLCTNEIDTGPDRAAYSLMLNPRGGIEADVTVTRLDEQALRIVSGAATRMKDPAWIERHRRRLGLVAEVFDATSSEAVLGVAGPRSRELLRTLTPTNLSNEAWPFAASRQIELAAASIRMTRLSFTGELGFERYIPVENAPAVYESIAGAGQDLGLAHCGHFALDGCRLEKGYRHWGQDIGAHDTPLEAGLGFAVAWDKSGGFIGHDALLARRETGMERRLLQFAGAGAHPLLLHDEPVYRGGTLVGHTTSGGRGFRTGLALCFAYVQCEPGAARSDLLGDGYEIGVAGERFPLRALARPAYDPHGAQLRS